METNITRIKHTMKEKANENMRFYSFIKNKFGFGDRNLKKLVAEITQDVWSKINCTQCGNCCREVTPQLNRNDISRVSAKLCLSSAEFKKRYLRYDTSENEHLIIALPCPFLVGNSCSIQEYKPKECREFPYLHKDIRERMHGFLERAEICPVVFNVLEELKNKLWAGRY